jgi:hypothetical protein
VNRFANQRCLQVNKSVGKGLASAIDGGEKAVDSTKHTLGSAKRKSTDAAQEAKGTAQEKMDQASESTKQATEDARQKFNQATGEAGHKADRVRLFSLSFSLDRLTCIRVYIPGSVRVPASQGRHEV